MPKAVWLKWVAWTAHRERGEALALFRIGTGLSLVFLLTGVIAADVIDPLWLRIADGGYVNVTGTRTWLWPLVGGVEAWLVYALTFGGVVLGLAMVVGFGGRWTILLAGQFLLALSALNGEAKGSYDALLLNALFILFWSDSTATLSWDAIRRGGRFFDDRPVPAWPRRVALFQLAVVYGFNGIQKVSSAWVPAGDLSALYYILQQPSWTRVDGHFFAFLFPLTQLGTLVTWAFEVFAPLTLALVGLGRRPRPGFVARRLGPVWPRRIFIGVGAMLHFGIFVFLDVGPFSPAILSFYFCLFTGLEAAVLVGTLDEKKGP